MLEFRCLKNGWAEALNQSRKGTREHLMELKSLSLFGKLSLSPVLLFAAAIALTGTASAQEGPTRPCDLYASATPCVAAISTTRALYKEYTGPLYQVTRESDKKQTNVGLLRDGYADAAKQDRFCANTSCTITKLYDQSANHNDMALAPPGGAARGPGPNGHDIAAVANAVPVMIAGH